MKEDRRSIKTSFWTDPYIEQLDSDTKMLFNSILSFPENNIAGVFEISDKKISYYTSKTEETISKSLDRLEQDGKIMRFKNWLAIRNHIKNQKLNPGMAISVVKDLCSAPNHVKLWLFYKEDSKSPEPWIRNLIFLVNKYYKDQKDRYIINCIKKNPELKRDDMEDAIPDIEINLENFLMITTEDLPFRVEEISNISNILTLTQWLHDPLVKEECKYKKEIGIVNNEIMNINVNTWTLDDLIRMLDFWNKQDLPKFPESKYKTGVNIPDVQELLKNLSFYTHKEISGAITNYSKIWNDSNYTVFPSYPTAVSFLKKGIDSYYDEAKPFERCKTKQSFIGQDYKPTKEQLKKAEKEKAKYERKDEG